MRYKQRCKQRQWDIYKDVNKGNAIDIQRGKQMSMIYIYIQRCKQRQLRYIQRCKQMQWDIYKDVNKCNEWSYTKM